MRIVKYSIGILIPSLLNGEIKRSMRSKGSFVYSSKLIKMDMALCDKTAQENQRCTYYDDFSFKLIYYAV